MRATESHHLLRSHAIGIAICVICGIFWAVSISGASLVVWTDGEQPHDYELNEVKQVLFAGDELQIVSEYGTDTYLLETVIRMDFLGDITDAEGPEDAAKILKAVHLFQNYPNPFNPSTQIKFELPEKGIVKLRIYMVNGRLVRTLLEKNLPAGPYNVRWDGRDDAGHSVASGVYFYSLSTPFVQESRKMILLR